MTYFLTVWRKELPWVKIRSDCGPFTHCGLCDYLKLLIGASQDACRKHTLLMRLGEHYDFQGAQRVYMNNVFAESVRNPDELLAVSWDKMDQAKNIIPRVRALSNTQFMKGGSRIVVSLIGVLIPAISQRPWFYTVFEDMVHGGDMIASLMIDVLLEAALSRGQLPRRFVIQADNTAKETKNTITLFAAAWLLAQLQHTRLQFIEFCYLIVGHTHDLIDAIFAWVGKAVHGYDVLSLPEFFSRLVSHMKNPPFWKHHRDVFAFQAHQPAYLTSRSLKGISVPHHVRLGWSANGGLVVQTKRWLTSAIWSEPLQMCSPQQVAELRALTFPIVQHAWREKGFEQSALLWLGKLRALLQQAGRSCNGLTHCEQVIRHELPALLPSGETLQEKIRRILSGTGKRGLQLSSHIEGLDEACAAAFPGTSKGLRPLLQHACAKP